MITVLFVFEACSKDGSERNIQSKGGFFSAGKLHNMILSECELNYITDTVNSSTDYLNIFIASAINVYEKNNIPFVIDEGYISALDSVFSIYCSSLEKSQDSAVYYLLQQSCLNDEDIQKLYGAYLNDAMSESGIFGEALQDVILQNKYPESLQVALEDAYDVYNYSSSYWSNYEINTSATKDSKPDANSNGGAINKDETRTEKVCDALMSLAAAVIGFPFGFWPGTIFGIAASSAASQKVSDFNNGSHRFDPDDMTD